MDYLNIIALIVGMLMGGLLTALIMSPKKQRKGKEVKGNYEVFHIENKTGIGGQIPTHWKENQPMYIQVYFALRRLTRDARTEDVVDSLLELNPAFEKHKDVTQAVQNCLHELRRKKMCHYYKEGASFKHFINKE